MRFTREQYQRTVAILSIALILVLSLSSWGIPAWVRKANTERTRADSLSAELAECRAGNPCVPELNIGHAGNVTAIEVWINGELRLFHADTTGGAR